MKTLLYFLTRTILLVLCILSLTACSNSNRAPADLNMVISISSDGNYAIATNTNKQAVLWNLKDHTYKIVFKNANIYSAYFIKNTETFMYQNDATNEVIIENTNGNIIKTFNPGFLTFGEVITSDLKNYFGADITLTLYKFDLSNNQKTVINQSWCSQDHNFQKYSGAATAECIDFRGSGQGLSLQLTPDQTKLIGSNFGYLFIWDIATGKGIRIMKNDSQTVAAINPDGSYVVAGDLNKIGYYFSLKDHSGYNFFITTPENELTKAYFESYNQNTVNELLALKFIDANHIIVIFSAVPDLFNFAGLYDMDHMSTDDRYWTKKYQGPIKYFPLIPNAATDTNYQKDWPLTSDDFSRDEAIDTSPSAHILVMSMAEKNGIIVYRYDPVTQTLTREWAGEVKPWWEF